MRRHFITKNYNYKFGFRENVVWNEDVDLSCEIWVVITNLQILKGDHHPIGKFIL